MMMIGGMKRHTQLKSMNWESSKPYHPKGLLMSRSYKKHPYFLMIGDKSFKKIYNRRIRRTHLVDDIDSGGSYKKFNDSWNICD